MAQVSLDTPAPNPDISLGDTTVVPNDSVVDSRSAKAAMGIGPIVNQDQPQIKTQIAQGAEKPLRDQAAAAIDYTNQKNFIAKGGYTADELMKFLQQNKTMPDSVIEQAYAQSYMKQAQQASDRSDAKPLDHPAAPTYMDRGSDLLAWREYAISKAQDIDPEVKKDVMFSVPFLNTPLTPEGKIDIGSRTAPVSTLINWATLGISGGIQEEWLLRGNTPATSRLSGIFAGSNVISQAQEIANQPTVQDSIALIDKGYNRIKQWSPALAQQWLMDIAGMSTSDMLVRNAMSGLNIGFGLAAGKTVKAGLEAIGRRQLTGAGIAGKVEGVPDIKSTQTAMRDVEDLVAGKPVDLEKTIANIIGDQPAETAELWALQRTVEDFVKDAPPSPTKRRVAQAIGDTKEAAVQKLIEMQTAPNPEMEAIDALMDQHKLNRQLIENFPGDATREEMTRLLDATDGTEKRTAKTLLDTMKLVRLPALAENGYRELAGRWKEYFSGAANSIVNGEVFYNAVTNTLHHVVTMANYDGRPFAYAEQAANFVRENKYGGARIVGADPNTLYVPFDAIFEKDAATGRLTPRDLTHVKDAEGHWHFYQDTRTDTEYHEPNPRSELIVRTEPEPTDVPFDVNTGKFGQPLGEGPHIVPKGMGYYVKWYLPVNETSDWVRDLLVSTTRTRSSMSGRGFLSDFFNGSWLGYFRNPADTFSHAQAENAVKNVYTQTKHHQLLMADYNYVSDLYNGLMADESRPLSWFGNLTGRNKQVWDDFKRALAVAQKYPDPDTGLPGYYFRTPLEIQHFWMSSFNRPASIAEQQAYLAVGRMDYIDWVFRNIAVYKNKSRIGVMSHTLMNRTKETFDTPSLPERGATFEGMITTKVPGGTVPVALHKDGRLSLYNNLSGQARKAIQEGLDNGKYRAIKLHNPELHDIQIMDRDGNPVRVSHVISDNVESNPLEYKQVGFRSGGHWDYAYDNYIKQPIIRSFKIGKHTYWTYEGDAVFAPIVNHADGEIFIKKLNAIKQLMRENRMDEAKKLHLSYSSQDWADFQRGFQPYKDSKTGKVMPARFNLHEDFRVVPKGYTIGDFDKNWLDKYKTGKGKGNSFINSAAGEQNPARNFQVEYTGARDSHDLFEPYNTGTLTNPLYKFRPAELTDPLVAQTRALRRLMQSAVGDDYKYMAVEHWVEEARKNGLLDSNSTNLARHSPFAVFMNPELTRASKFGRKGLLGQAAMANRYKIQKLIGMPTYMDSQIQMWKQALADEIFTTDTSTLTGKAKKAALVVPSWMLGKVHSPTSFFRGLAFHENLGLFNWMQLASQNAAYVNFFALSPTHAIPGIYGAWMHLGSRINRFPAILEAMDKNAAKFGWKPGWFLEAMKAYENSGFGDIANTLAIHDPDSKFLLSNADKVLRLGSKYFFDLAEQNVRHGAWYTAYHEYKRAFPNTPITRVELGKISSRANDLYMNMGRDSKSALNTGATSMTLQFFKYIENAGNMFLSKRIGDVFGKENTWQLRAQQRAQMIVAYSMFFGPLGATGLSLLPINDIVRKQALENEYVPGANFWSTLLAEGPASMAGAYLSGWWRSGDLDMSKGTFYNFNNRYGANGYQLLRDVLENSPTFWQVILGASGSTLSNNLASLSPFVYAWKSAINDEQDNPYPITLDMWLDGARNINSLRAADKLRYAIQFGKWIDRHGRPQQDVGKIDATFRTLLGVNDVNLDDLFLMRQTIRDEQHDYTKVSQEFQRIRRLQNQAIENKDYDQALVYGKQANFVLQSSGVPPEEIAKIMHAQRNLETNTQTQTYRDFYERIVPMYRKDSAQDAAIQHYKQAQ